MDWGSFAWGVFAGGFVMMMTMCIVVAGDERR